MKTLIRSLVCTLCILMTSCVSTSPLTPANLPKLKLVSLYEDEVVVLSNPTLLAVLEERVLLAGIGAETSEQIKNGLTRAGYQVRLAGIAPEAFWAKFETTSKTKEGSSSHLGVLQNLKVTLKTLLNEGSFTVEDGEVVMVVGPLGTHYGANFMSRAGSGLNLFKDPFSKLGTGLTAEIHIFDVRTMEVVGYGTALIRTHLDFDKNRFDFKNLSPADKSELTAAILKAIDSNIHGLTQSLKYRATASSSSK